MRVLAIGDIHGCFKALVTLEKTVRFDEGDVLVTVGDYVDRGRDSMSVLDWLIDRKASGGLIPLMGNHELMMLAALRSEAHRDEWLSVGGDTTLRSYGRNKSLADIPDDHWRFLKHCRPYYETQTHFFVHANASPDMPLEDQPDFMLYWEHFRDPVPRESGRVRVCGHTPQRSGYPLSVGHAVCIDTWAHGRGWLTCLDVASGQYWQANESKQTRTGFIDQDDKPFSD